MENEGNLLKMKTELKDEAQYFLNIGAHTINMNDLVGNDIRFEYKHKINCIRCGRETKKSFFQGYCYPCFISAPETDECILHPEKCRAHEGISRDMEWSKTHCLIDHYVYLAVSSGLKVGVTRHTQVPTRWIDQGAHEAVKLAKAPNRHIAGLIEVDLKQHLADKTNWQQMLKNQVKRPVDLLEEKKRAAGNLRQDLQKYLIDDNTIEEINYPVRQYPAKVKSLSFDKVGDFSGRLMGIKGQYLLFEDGTVFNVRKHNGYLAALHI
jgi:hypothetical protein